MKHYYYIYTALLCAAMILTACSSRTEHEEEAHLHEETVGITVYGSNIEAYAEATPLAMGQESHILLHLSSLDNFKPLECQSVKAVLTDGSDGGRQTIQAEPKAPGIYELHITPGKAGAALLTVFADSESLSLPLTVYDDEHEAEQAAIEAEPKSADGVKFTKEQSWKIDFQTQECRMESFGPVIKTAGRVLPSQRGSITLSAKASGIVVLGASPVLPGTRVRKGQMLFSIENSTLSDSNMEVSFARARNEYFRAKSEYERKLKLAESKIISQSELSQAKAEYDNAEALYKSMEGNFKDGKYIITAPADGFISDAFVSNGEFVQAGQELAVFSSSNAVMVEARLLPRYSNVVGSIREVSFRIPGNDSVMTLSELEGKMVSAARSVPAGMSTLPVTFELQNGGNFVPGTFVDVIIRAEGDRQVVTVPSGALIEDMGSFFVFKQITPEFFEKVHVVPGSSDGSHTEIVSGLSGDERVVSKGAVLVKLAQSSGTLDAHSGHVH